MSDRVWSIEVAWPPSVLAPNARAHWRIAAPARTKYRDECAMIARASRSEFVRLCGASQTYALALRFVPATKRRRDDDNLVAAFKAGRDGIAVALGIDDSRFVLMPVEIADALARPPRVIVSLWALNLARRGALR